MNSQATGSDDEREANAGNADASGSERSAWDDWFGLPRRPSETDHVRAAWVRAPRSIRDIALSYEATGHGVEDRALTKKRHRAHATNGPRATHTRTISNISATDGAEQGEETSSAIATIDRADDAPVNETATNGNGANGDHNGTNGNGNGNGSHADGAEHATIIAVAPAALAPAVTAGEAEPVAEAAATTEAAHVPPTPPADDTARAGDAPPPRRARPRRSVTYLLGTALMILGILIPTIVVGASLINNHKKSDERAQFLKRVNTPSPIIAANAPIPVTLSPSGARAATPTLFPSTVAGAQVPNNAQTPTANNETRAAQPVSTTQASNRQIVAGLPPAPTKAPATPRPAPTPTTIAPTSADVGNAPPADSPAPTPEPEPTPMPAPEPQPKMPAPTHLLIPSLRVDSDVTEVGVSPIEIDGQQALIWDVAPYAVGHHFSSANPGEGENVVLSGHDDWQGEVFKNLWKLKQGDKITVKTNGRDWTYHVDEILLLPETGESLEKRIQNAAFIGTTGDERLTLITCWPYGVDDHRLVVIAHPDAA